MNYPIMFVISGFRSKVDRNCFLLGYYATSSGNFLPKFRDNLAVPSSGVKNPVVCARISDVTLYKISRGRHNELLLVAGRRKWVYHFMVCSKVQFLASKTEAEPASETLCLDYKSTMVEVR